MFSAPGGGAGISSSVACGSLTKPPPFDTNRRRWGIAKDTKPDALSNVSPCWIVCEVMQADCGVHFDPAVLGQWNIPLQETVT